MDAKHYHDSFLTDNPILLPRFIPKGYDKSLLPNFNVSLAKLADPCPQCGSMSLFGTYKVRGHKVTKVTCWNINCLWSDEGDTDKRSKRNKPDHFDKHNDKPLLNSFTSDKHLPYMI